MFCGVLRAFCNFLDVFICDFLCENFLSERKMHTAPNSTVLRCIAQSAKCILFVFVRFVYCLVCFGLFREKRERIQYI